MSKTYCINGHLYTIESTMRDWRGYRKCRICYEDHKRSNNLKRREAKVAK